MRFDSESKRVLEQISFLDEHIENLIPRLEKIFGVEIYYEKSHSQKILRHVNFEVPNYGYYTVCVTNYDNYCLHCTDATIYINGKLWSEVRKELIAYAEYIAIKSGSSEYSEARYNALKLLK